MAALKTILRPEAEDDVDGIAAFYVSCSEDGRLAARFLRSLYTTIDRVAAFPRSGALLGWGVRRTLLDTFPYWVYYRVLDQRLEVIGVLHAKRDQELWERLE